jgi:hypothetical protein
MTDISSPAFSGKYAASAQSAGSVQHTVDIANVTTSESEESIRILVGVPARYGLLRIGSLIILYKISISSKREGSETQ